MKAKLAIVALATGGVAATPAPIADSTPTWEALAGEFAEGGTSQAELTLAALATGCALAGGGVFDDDDLYYTTEDAHAAAKFAMGFALATVARDLDLDRFLANLLVAAIGRAAERGINAESAAEFAERSRFAAEFAAEFAESGPSEVERARAAIRAGITIAADNNGGIALPVQAAFRVQSELAIAAAADGELTPEDALTRAAFAAGFALAEGGELDTAIVPYDFTLMIATGHAIATGDPEGARLRAEFVDGIAAGFARAIADDRAPDNGLAVYPDQRYLSGVQVADDRAPDDGLAASVLATEDAPDIVARAVGCAIP